MPMYARINAMGGRDVNMCVNMCVWGGKLKRRCHAV